MKNAKDFLKDWTNNVSNEVINNESLEYSEREVIEIMNEFVNQFTLIAVNNTPTCPYRVQNSCNFTGMCTNEFCDIRAK